MDNNVVKKTLYKQLVIKVSDFDTEIQNTSGLLTKTQYDSGKKGL